MRRRRARQRRWWGDRWQAKDKGSDRLKSHKQPITAARRRTERGRDGVEMESGGAGMGWVEGTVCWKGGYIHVAKRRSRADSLLYFKFHGLKFY